MRISLLLVFVLLCACKPFKTTKNFEYSIFVEGQPVLVAENLSTSEKERFIVKINDFLQDFDSEICDYPSVIAYVDYVSIYGKENSRQISYDYAKRELVIRVDRDLPVSSDVINYLRDAIPLAVEQACSEAALPEEIEIKNQTQTFTEDYYLALRCGKLYVKSMAQGAEWKLFGGVGLPYDKKSGKVFDSPLTLDQVVTELDEILVISDKRKVYYHSTESLWFEKNRWYDIWSVPPTNDVLFIPADSRSIAFSKRAEKNIGYFEDIDGNQLNGGPGVTTFVSLSKDGSEISYADTGLPPDFSHKFCSPFRNRFIAENLTIGASTLFVINRNGEMYTKLADFDIGGNNPMMFTYTYEHEIRFQDGLNDAYSFGPMTISTHPNKEWLKHTRIETVGAAFITNQITVVPNGGFGNNARELRVVGRDESGSDGYYYKDLDENEWKFKISEVSYRPADILVNDPYGGTPLTPRKDYSLNGNFKIGEGKEIRAYLKDFNLHCSPSQIILNVAGHEIDLNLYMLPGYSYFTQNDPGRDGMPLIKYATLEIPDYILNHPVPEVRNFVENHLLKYQMDFIALNIFSSKNYVVIEDPTDEHFKMVFKRDANVEVGDYIAQETGDYIQKIINDYSAGLKDDQTILESIYKLKSLRRKLEEDRKEHKRRVLLLSGAVPAFDLLNLIGKLTFVASIKPYKNFPMFKNISKYGHRILAAVRTQESMFKNSADKVYRQMIELLDKKINSRCGEISDSKGSVIFERQINFIPPLYVGKNQYLEEELISCQ